MSVNGPTLLDPMESNSRPAPYRAFEAALACARAVSEVFATESEVTVHTSYRRPPTDAMVARMSSCLRSLEDSAREGKQCVEPWKFELAEVGGPVSRCGVTASSEHLLSVKIAEKFARLKWSREEVLAYYARFTNDAGELDWDARNALPVEERIEDSLVYLLPFALDEVEAGLECEHAELRRQGVQGAPLPRTAPTVTEKKILKALRTSGRAMTGDEIALAIRAEPGSGHVKTTLSGLVKRKILVNERSQGGYYENPDSKR